MGDTTYVWRCGEKVAHIHSIDRTMLEFDKVTNQELMVGVARLMGPVDHKHNFELTEAFENISVVVYDCWPRKEEIRDEHE